MQRIIGLSILPPMAVARLGSSDTALECYEWVKSRDAHGGSQNVILPAPTLRVLPDGTLEPYVPETIRFRDGEKLRPVAPFFELWVRTQSDEDGSVGEEPLTLTLLEQRGLSLEHLRFRVTAANRKAQRRTGKASCAFIARVEVSGADHESKELLAVSPVTSGEEALVVPGRPIPLGQFRVLQPKSEVRTLLDHGEVDLGVVRLRYTPAKGKVYGPPRAVSAPASPVQPGVVAMAPASHDGRIHEIVPEENRILNGDTEWSKFVMEIGEWIDTLPMDSYDGANVGDSRSWGIVDDTCDLVIEATLVAGVSRFAAVARAFTGPPDYAPDRRTFYSVHDDLEDREVSPDEFEVTPAEIASIFTRAFETGSLLNLDAARARALAENAWTLEQNGNPSLAAGERKPRIDAGSMTYEDTPYVDKLPALLREKNVSTFSDSIPYDPIPYARIMSFVHGPLADEEVLVEFLRLRGAHVKELVRPPFRNWGEFSPAPPTEASPELRDPRVLRDKLHDMRMPPYMRDANFFPLSMTRRQYIRLLKFIERLAPATAGTSGPTIAGTSGATNAGTSGQTNAGTTGQTTSELQHHEQ